MPHATADVPTAPGGDPPAALARTGCWPPLLAACASVPPAGTAAQSRPASQVPAPLGGAEPGGAVAGPSGAAARRRLRPPPPSSRPRRPKPRRWRHASRTRRCTTPRPPSRAAAQAFTSKAELQSLLRGLVREATRRRDRACSCSRSALSQSGMPIEALLLTRAGPMRPAPRCAAPRRPTVLLIGQQHGDEPAGSEALLVLARQLAQGPLRAAARSHQRADRLPRANPDGAQAGRRATASGIDVNRDHLLLRTPEAQALARLVREYRAGGGRRRARVPGVGPVPREVRRRAARRRAAAVRDRRPTCREFVTRAAEEWFRQPLLASLQREGLSAEWYYTHLDRPGDKQRRDGRHAARHRRATSAACATPSAC